MNLTRTTPCLDHARAAASARAGSPALHVAPSQRAQALAGYHVLLLTSDRALRDEACTPCSTFGVVVDVVTSVGEAEEFCQDGLPHAFMFDASGRNPALGDLIAELLRQAPAMAVVELLAGDAPTRLSTATPDGLARHRPRQPRRLAARALDVRARGTDNPAHACAHPAPPPAADCCPVHRSRRVRWHQP